jgi:hypothetical protein
MLPFFKARVTAPNRLICRDIGFVSGLPRRGAKASNLSMMPSSSGAAHAVKTERLPPQRVPSITARRKRAFDRALDPPR